MPPRTPSIPIPGDDTASLRASVVAIREVLLGMGLVGSIGEGVLTGVAPPLVARDPKAAMELTTRQWVEAAIQVVATLAALGEANTNSNSGAGAGIALAKVGVDLPLKSFTAGAGIALTPSSTELAIAVAFSAAIHGNLAGGSLHALAVTAGAAGFLSGVDKTKLDALALPPYAASDVEALEVGTATYDDLQDFINLAWSGGQFTGGEVTVGGGETVDCAAVTGMIRDADSVTSNVLFFDITVDNLAIPTDTTRFVRINYNAGAPTWELATIEEVDREDIIHMAKVTNDGGVLHISSLVDHAGNVPNRFSHVLKSVFGVHRADNDGGLMLGEGGTRYVTVTAGQIFYGEHRSDFTDKDTDPGGGADTFATEYFNGSVWVTTTGVSQWPNTQYNNVASGLVTMTTNRWAVLWFYAETDDDLSMIYGSAQYTSQALAELETVPLLIPSKLFEHGLLIGRLIFKKSAAIAEVESAFLQAFVPTSVVSHIELPDLTTGDAGHTQFPLKTLWDANSVLVAVSDDTPIVQAVAASEFVGRKATGDVGAMTAAEAATVLTALLKADGSRDLTGDMDVTPGKSIRWGHANESNADDGKIGAALFVQGLNIVGTQTIGGNGRIIATWGDIAPQQAGDTFDGRDVSVDGTKLDTIDTGANKIPSGMMAPFGGTSAPGGWLLCDGASISRTTYAGLFAAIGTAYGTASGSTFNVPDFEGRFLRGTDNAAGRDPDAAARTAMATGGNTSDNIGSIQDDAFQGHWHTLRDDTTALYAGGGVHALSNISQNADVNNVVRAPISDGVNGTPRITSETRSLNANVNWIIKT